MITTRQTYDQDLDSLRHELMEMGNQVKVSIENAVQSLANQDAELAKQVLSDDDIIDKMEEKIDDKCMWLIAKQQPLAKDLRIISTALKITTDLERMGDHAYDIANVTLRLNNQPLIKPLIDIPLMALMAQNMLQNSLEAYTNLDIVMAEKVCKSDDEVDNLHHQIFRELLTYMIEDPRTISQATQLILVARYLERIADHVTNIAEWVIYLVTGLRPKK